MKLKKSKENKQAQIFCKKFLDKKVKRYLFGTNDYAISIAKALNNEIEGFINDFIKDSSFFNKPIFKLKDIQKDALIVSCVVLSQAINVKERLDSLGFKSLSYFAFYKYSGLNIKDIEFVNIAPNGLPYTIKDAKDDLEQNLESYKEIYQYLSDKKSKYQFKQCLNFRLHCDIKMLQGIKYTPKEQYFEDFIGLENIDYFIDIGAFEGESSLEFIKHNQHYKSIFCFEPENKNFLKTKENLKNYNNIQIYQCGLGEKEQELFITNNQSSANKVLSQNLQNSTLTQKIDIKTLDSIILNNKMIRGGVQHKWEYVNQNGYRRL